MPSAKPQILIVGALVWANAEVDSLKGDYHVLVLDSPDRATFVNELKTGKYSQICAIYRHNSSAASVGVFDEELIQAMPESLAYICHNGAGESILTYRLNLPDSVPSQVTTKSTSPHARLRVS